MVTGERGRDPVIVILPDEFKDSGLNEYLEKGTPRREGLPLLFQRSSSLFLGFASWIPAGAEPLWDCTLLAFVSHISWIHLKRQSTLILADEQVLVKISNQEMLRSDDEARRSHVTVGGALEFFYEGVGRVAYEDAVA